MPRFTFICEHDGDEFGEYRRNEVTFNVETWGEVLEEVESFLRGSGFHFDGNVDMVENEVVKPEPIWNFQPLDEAIRRMKEQHSDHYFDVERNR